MNEQRLLSPPRDRHCLAPETSFLFTDRDLNSHSAPQLEKQTGFTEPISSEQVCLQGPVSTQNNSGQMHVELRAQQPAAPPPPQHLHPHHCLRDKREVNESRTCKKTTTLTPLLFSHTRHAFRNLCQSRQTGFRTPTLRKQS